jgi:hypothetical protein
MCWTDFMKIFGTEAIVQAGAVRQPKPAEVWGFISDRTSETLLNSLRVGRPFALGTTCDYYHPIGRVHKLLLTLLSKYQPDDVHKMPTPLTTELSLGLMLYAWENRHSQSPFEILILPDETEGSTSGKTELAFVRAKQELIRDQTLASDGGPSKKHSGQQSEQWGTDRPYSSSWQGNGGGDEGWKSNWNK